MIIMKESAAMHYGQALDRLRTAVIHFESAAKLANKTLDHLAEVRPDDGVTQLFIESATADMTKVMGKSLAALERLNPMLEVLTSENF